MKINCIIRVYDPKVKKAPFNIIEIDRFQIEVDHSKNFYHEIVGECYKRNYSFRFYNIDDNNNYCIIVHNYQSPGSELYTIDHLNGENKIEYIEPETCKCKWCGAITDNTGTEMCDRCWELYHRIEMNPSLVEKMLESYYEK